MGIFINEIKNNRIEKLIPKQKKNLKYFTKLF